MKDAHVQATVEEARRWIGTRFKHQGRLRKTEAHAGGVDCLGLVIGVAAALELKDRHGRRLALYDETDYSKSPDGAHLKSTLEILLAPVPFGAASPGDIGLFVWDSNPQHLAILSDYASLSSSRELGESANNVSGNEPYCPGSRAIGLRSRTARFSTRSKASGKTGFRDDMRNLGMIHAYAPARKVVEHGLDAAWRARLAGVYRYW